MTYYDDIKSAASVNLPWERLAGKNILVTGATGLIGACLVKVLLSRPEIDYEVFALGRNKNRADKLFLELGYNSHFHFLQCDINTPLDTDVAFHYIIHAASDANPSAYVSSPVEIMKSNFLGLGNLLDYGKDHNLKRLLYVSSGEVYGEGDGRVFDESYSGYVNCLSPRSCYPTAKRAAESLCVAYSQEYHTDCVIARPCHVYGPEFSGRDNRVYAQFIRNVINDEDIIMKSSGEQFRSWCYVVDCASALLTILLKGVPGEAYNIADNESNVSIKELAETVAGIAGKKVIIEIPDENERKGYNVVTKSVFNTERLKSLGWAPKTSFYTGLKHSIEWRKAVCSGTD